MAKRQHEYFFSGLCLAGAVESSGLFYCLYLWQSGLRVCVWIAAGTQRLEHNREVNQSIARKSQGL